MAKKLIVFPEILFEDFDQFFKGLVKSNHWIKLYEILRKDQYLYSLSNGGVSFCKFLLFPSFFYDFNDLLVPPAIRSNQLILRAKTIKIVKKEGNNKNRQNETPPFDKEYKYWSFLKILSNLIHFISFQILYFNIETKKYIFFQYVN